MSFEVCLWVKFYGHWLDKWKLEIITLKAVLSIVYEITISMIN